MNSTVGMATRTKLNFFPMRARCSFRLYLLRNSRIHFRLCLFRHFFFSVWHYIPLYLYIFNHCWTPNVCLHIFLLHFVSRKRVSTIYTITYDGDQVSIWKRQDKSATTSVAHHRVTLHFSIRIYMAFDGYVRWWADFVPFPSVSTSKCYIRQWKNDNMWQYAIDIWFFGANAVF